MKNEFAHINAVAASSKTFHLLHIVPMKSYRIRKEKREREKRATKSFVYRAWCRRRRQRGRESLFFPINWGPTAKREGRPQMGKQSTKVWREKRSREKRINEPSLSAWEEEKEKFFDWRRQQVTIYLHGACVSTVVRDDRKGPNLFELQRNAKKKSWVFVEGVVVEWETCVCVCVRERERERERES